MKFALDWWYSKVTLAAIATTLAIAATCISPTIHWPTLGQDQMLLIAWLAAFGRDTLAKGLTGLLPGQGGAAPVKDISPANTTGLGV